MRLPAVIIPVFNAFEHLRACLDSVAAASPGPISAAAKAEHYEVLLIDDASTDQRVRPLLETWVSEGPARSLLKNDQNRGFVFSINRGISQLSGDIVLLNSDTLVTPGWLEALANCLASDPDIATATPWSNNGEIVSFPDFCTAGPVPENPAQFAAAIRSAGSPVYPALPTAVGFCMAISRHAIERIGLFDEQTFGRGYGEENDFSMRVVAEGMKNVLCDNAYVAHHGGGSFVPLGLRPDSDSMRRLLGKHPRYQKLIEAFIREDPLQARRRALTDSVQRWQGGIR